MSALQAGIETFRFWDNTETVAAENAPWIDRAQLQPSLLRHRADATALVRAIERDGIAVIPQYWPAEACAEGRREIERLLSEHPDVVHNASRGSDRRIFGVEAASPLLASFHGDPFLRSLGELLGGLELYNFATLGARIDATPDNNGSGDGWHRDAHGFQFKSILYLSDVSEENGPFEYLCGSHGRWRTGLQTVLGRLPPAPNSRYEPAMIDRLRRLPGTRLRGFPARAGTLLLVNTAGIHRGRPLTGGRRYALTNYYYHPFQVHEDRIRQFSPIMPGMAQRVRSDLGGSRNAHG